MINVVEEISEPKKELGNQFGANNEKLYDVITYELDSSSSLNMRS
jgi:hypothetical protein